MRILLGAREGKIEILFKDNFRITDYVWVSSLGIRTPVALLIRVVHHKISKNTIEGYDRSNTDRFLLNINV